MTTQIIDPEIVGLEETLEVIEYDEAPEDPDHRTHIINETMNTHIWEPGMNAQDIVDIARATGQQVVGLCGYVQVPKHNPEKFDVCEACIKIAGDIMRELGE